MLQAENQQREYKSVRLIQGAKPDLASLSETCVCLANAQGGLIFIGIEDDTRLPPPDQRISTEQANSVITRLQTLTSGVGIADYEVITHENTGQYIQFRILPSSRVIAVTSKGKVFVRVADQCRPVSGEDLTRLAAEKGAFQWETVIPSRRITLSELSTASIIQFVRQIRLSDRVKESVKQKADAELLEHYNLVDNDIATNLGVLWLGTTAQRSRLSYPITVEYLVYDERESRVRKEAWHDASLNPYDLITEIEAKTIELQYAHELPDGLFRRKIPFYNRAVIRELLVNAMAHRSYVISGDISIRVYPDYVELSSPGSLPMGITPDNILHKKFRRNPHLITLFHDLNLMEGEGSGYDKIYELLARDSKPLPIVESDFDSVTVRLWSQIVDQDVLFLMDFVGQHYELTQREVVALGVIARHQKLLSPQLARILQLPEEERLRPYVSRLVSEKIVLTRGVKKGTTYLVNPALYRSARINKRPTLKTIEPHVLEALVLQDISTYPQSRISEIHQRLPDVLIQDLAKVVYGLVEANELEAIGGRKNRAYSMARKR
jgi:ATP-dependent DNA helicase RecG